MMKKERKGFLQPVYHSTYLNVLHIVLFLILSKGLVCTSVGLNSGLEIRE